MDLLFSRRGFIEFEINKIKTFSDHRDGDFLKYGVFTKLRLLARAYLLIRKTLYVMSNMKEISTTDYEAALKEGLCIIFNY